MELFSATDLKENQRHDDGISRLRRLHSLLYILAESETRLDTVTNRLTS
jgi:hypothetical protein